MDIPTPAYTAIGAIVAAVIGGGMSFISTVLTKDQKTSEFRQSWIDGLRNDIAEEVSHFNVLIDSIRSLVEQGKSRGEILEYISTKEDSLSKLELVDTRIKLRINPIEHRKLSAALSGLEEYVRVGDFLRDKDKGKELVEILINESQVVLKTEWKRVKRGEPVFVATKWTSLLIFLTATCLGILYSVGHLHIVFE